MSNSNRRHTVDEVLTALHLCGPDYHNGACEKCPFIRDCLPGDNDALVAEAALTIETLLRMNDEAMAKLGKTVFLKKADAEKEIRRLQHGYR